MSNSPPVVVPKVVEHVLLAQDELAACTAIVQKQYRHSEIIVNGIVVRSNLNFCKTCTVAGVSTIAFEEQRGSHFQHQRLQIFKDMYGFEFVRVSDIEDIVDTDEVAVYAYTTEEPVYYLGRRTLGPEERYIMTCKGCNKIVPNAEADDLRRRNEVHVKVCSIECLVEYDRAQRGDESTGDESTGDEHGDMMNVVNDEV